MSVTVAVVCKPGSSRPGITVEDGVVHLRVRERAIEGEANKACIRALSEALGISQSRISLVGGTRGRHKRFEIEGLDPTSVSMRLESRFRAE